MIGGGFYFEEFHTLDVLGGLGFALGVLVVSGRTIRTYSTVLPRALLYKYPIIYTGVLYFRPVLCGVYVAVLPRFRTVPYRSLVIFFVVVPSNPRELNLRSIYFHFQTYNTTTRTRMYVCMHM